MAGEEMMLVGEAGSSDQPLLPTQAPHRRTPPPPAAALGAGPGAGPTLAGGGGGAAGSGPGAQVSENLAGLPVIEGELVGLVDLAAARRHNKHFAIIN